MENVTKLSQLSWSNNETFLTVLLNHIRGTFSFLGMAKRNPPKQLIKSRIFYPFMESDQVYYPVNSVWLQQQQKSREMLFKGHVHQSCRKTAIELRKKLQSAGKTVEKVAYIS